MIQLQCVCVHVCVWVVDVNTCHPLTDELCCWLEAMLPSGYSRLTWSWCVCVCVRSFLALFKRPMVRIEPVPNPGPSFLEMWLCRCGLNVTTVTFAADVWGNFDPRFISLRRSSPVSSSWTQPTTLAVTFGLWASPPSSWEMETRLSLTFIQWERCLKYPGGSTVTAHQMTFDLDDKCVRFSPGQIDFEVSHKTLS